MQATGKSEMRGSRDNDLDIYRGCSMIYITCFLHNFYGVQVIDTVPTSMLLITMPIVFFISGASFSLASSKSYLQYVWRRIKRIVFPYYIYVAIVTAAYFLYKCVVNGVDSGSFFRQFVENGYYNIFSGKLFGFNHLWFIPPYIMVALLLPALNYVKRYVNQYFVYILCIALCAVLALFPCEIVCYASFAFVGLYYKQHFPARRYVIAAIMACAMIWCVCNGYSFNMQANKFPPNIMFFSYCALVVALFLSQIGRLCRAIYRIGFFKYFIDRYAQVGLTVYLYHSINVLLLQKLLMLYVSSRDLSPWEHLLLLVATSVVLFFGNIYLSMAMKRVESAIINTVSKLIASCRGRIESPK